MAQTDKMKVVHCMREPYDVYIGRRNNRAGLTQSKWANPFIVGKDGTLEEVLEKYRDKVTNDPELMAALHELKNQTIGCWCRPKRCHGDILIELVGKLEVK